MKLLANAGQIAGPVIVLASLLAHAQAGPGLVGRAPRPSPSGGPAPADPVETRFVQVAPQHAEEASFQRSPGQDRAIVLIHGLQIYPITTKINITRASFQKWQRPDSKFVAIMQKCADVYAFAYSQNVAMEEIAGVASFADNIQRLKVLGYADIVLIGHSAGGLIARQFVEDYPDAGVTKVIEVCTPNLGAAIAHLDLVPKPQRAFLHSLTKEGRAHVLSERAGKRIPDTVQFVCVVGDGAGFGDVAVANSSQWPRDLQEQGIPVVPLRTIHVTVMRTQATIQRVAEIAYQNLPRWSAARVAIARKELAGVE
jgi:pimeloyl-ACP methyl ester carboxylesterase